MLDTSEVATSQVLAVIGVHPGEDRRQKLILADALVEALGQPTTGFE
jgi:hypothetical protein